MNSAKKVFIAGGSLSELPLIQSTLLHGYEVITSGNKPTDIGHMWSHNFYETDYSDKEALLVAVRTIRPQILLSGANDFSYLSCCYVAENLGYKGFDPYDVAMKLHHKDTFGSLAAKLGLPRVKSVETKVDEFIGSPDTLLKKNKFFGKVLIKPVDLTGGKGIIAIDTRHSHKEFQIPADWRQSKSDKLVLEEFFEGTLHSYSAVIQNNEVIFSHQDNEYCFYNPYLVSTSETTSKIPPLVSRGLKEATEALAKNLSLVDGVLHCQFMLNGDNFVILEYTRRMSGDLYSWVVSAVYGWRHEDLFVHQAENKLSNFSNFINSKIPKNPWISRHCLTANKQGNFNRIKVDNSLQQFIRGFWLSRRKMDLLHGGGRGKAAVILLQYQDELTMNEMTKKLSKLSEVFTCQEP